MIHFKTSKTKSNGNKKVMKWKIMSNTIPVGLYWMGTSHNKYHLNEVANGAKTCK